MIFNMKVNDYYLKNHLFFCIVQQLFNKFCALFIELKFKSKLSYITVDQRGTVYKSSFEKAVLLYLNRDFLNFMHFTYKRNTYLTD